jgi:hypothetical protein
MIFKSRNKYIVKKNKNNNNKYIFQYLVKTKITIWNNKIKIIKLNKK